MRRGLVSLITASTIGFLAPTAFGQYPYPYGPMPVQYGPIPAQYMPMPGQPYGSPPMPAYGPSPMKPQPMPYPPMPMGQYPPRPNTKVFVYGPLEDPVVVAPPSPLTKPAKVKAAPVSASRPLARPVAAPSGVQQVQHDAYRTMPTYSKMDILPDSCGPGCDDCGPACGPGQGPCGDGPVNTPWMQGQGHFVGDVGAYVLAPFYSSRAAYSSSAGGISNFPQQVATGPRASVGYIFHTGWGLRGNYYYVQGVINDTAVNANPGATISTPLGVPLLSPGPALAAGVGADSYTFFQRLYVHVGDIEIVKETSFLDTTLLLSVGGRYARIQQSYTATRTNPGGVGGGNTFALDQADGYLDNTYEAWGPTLSLEAIHAIGGGFAIYGNGRGSFLWGKNQFTRHTRSQLTTVNAAGVAAFTDTKFTSTAEDTRNVSIGEAEAGVQFGCRVGRCYVYTRVGAVFQRWWDVGNPSNANGSVNFIGGAARLGLTF